MLQSLKSLINQVEQQIPPSVKDTALVRFFGFTKVPMLWYLKPQVLELNDSLCTVKIKLNRKSQNHLRSMYFGALAAGADCAAGLFAMKLILKSKRKVALAFKDFHADFLQRAEGDVLFTCDQGVEVKQLVQDVIDSGERKNLLITVNAYCPSMPEHSEHGQKVAVFALTLSLKLKG